MSHVQLTTAREGLVLPPSRTSVGNPREAEVNPIQHPPSEAFTIDLHCCDCERYKAASRCSKSASPGQRRWGSESATPPDAVGHSHRYGVEWHLPPPPSTVQNSYPMRKLNTETLHHPLSKLFSVWWSWSPLQKAVSRFRTGASSGTVVSGGVHIKPVVFNPGPSWLRKSSMNWVCQITVVPRDQDWKPLPLDTVRVLSFKS